MQDCRGENDHILYCALVCEDIGERNRMIDVRGSVRVLASLHAVFVRREGYRAKQGLYTKAGRSWNQLERQSFVRGASSVKLVERLIEVSVAVGFANAFLECRIG